MKNVCFMHMTIKRLFFSLPLLLVLMLGNTGCSSDDEYVTKVVVDEEDDDDPNVIATFRKSKADKDVADFFASELPISYQMKKGKPFNWNVKLNAGADESDTCIIINDQSDFSLLYRGEKPLPQIDFNSQTLIIGWKPSDAVSDIEKLVLRKENEGYSLDLCTLRYKEYAYLVETFTCYICFWGVFPKQTDAPIAINFSVRWVNEPK